MGATLVTPTTTSGGEIITHLINATDGEGLHFDGAAGNIVIAGDTTILDGASKISVEAIIATDSTSFASGLGHIIAKNYTSNCFYLSILNSGKIQFRVNNGSSNGTAETSGTYNDGNPKHVVGTWDGATVSIYINGNLDGTVTLAGGSIPNTADKLALGAGLKSDLTNDWRFNGIIYRARLFNYVIDPTRFYENATVSFADQYGVQTNKIAAAVDQDWGTAQADTGNDANDRATFNSAYVWETDGTPVDLSVASNLFTFTTNEATDGIRYPNVLTANKRYRFVINTGTITGSTFKVCTYPLSGGGHTTVGTLSASTKNVIEFIAESGTNSYLYILPTSATVGTIQLNAASVDNEIVEIGCVADYDLAFANPTQSDQVQDRAGVADGTASAGVTQVTKIEAINTNKLNVGGTTPLVGIGLDAGSTPAAQLHISDGGAINAPRANVALEISRTSAAGDDVYLGIQSGTTGKAGIVFGDSDDDALGYIEYDNDTNKLIFNTNKLTIDTTGSVEVRGDSATAYDPAAAQDSAGTTISAWNSNTTVNTYAAIQLAQKVGGAWGKARIVCSGASNQGELGFQVENAATYKEAMRIVGAGTVGLNAAGVTMTNTNGLLQLHGTGDGGARDGIFINSGVDEDHTLLNLTGLTQGGKLEWINSTHNFNFTKLTTFAEGIACSGGGVGTSANFGQIKTSTSTAITSGSTIPISSSNANGSLVTVYEGSSGKVIVFLVSFANVVIISDPGSYGSVTDVSDKFCMLGGGSHTCVLKNGFSGDKTVQIMAMGCGLE